MAEGREHMIVVDGLGNRLPGLGPARKILREEALVDRRTHFRRLAHFP